VRPLPTSWSRLHALSPVVRSVRAATALLVVLGTQRAGRGRAQPTWLDAILVGVVVVGGVVSWLVTRWRIHDGELQVESGLIRRQSVRLPLTRLQAVDVVRPLLGRVLGLAEVRVVVAGHSSARTRLAYLTEERAAEVRAQLLALAHGLDAATPEPAERPILSVDPGRLIVANAASTPTLVLLALVVASIALVVVDPTAGLALAGAIAPVVVIGALGIARQVGAEWDFTVAEAPDGLRLRSGLLQIRGETIPAGRAQAVREVQPLWWRPFGWVRLEIDVARRRDRDRSDAETATTTRALLPVGTPEQAQWLLARVLPGASTRPPSAAGARAPRRAIVRAPLLWHHLEAWHDDRYVVCGSGRLRRVAVVVPLAKAQSIRWAQGPVSRRLRLATVHLDTAGHHFPGSARFRPADEAQEWLAELPVLARAARAAEPARAVPPRRADQPPAAVANSPGAASAHRAPTPTTRT
jgi:putative membrane protein